MAVLLLDLKGFGPAYARLENLSGLSTQIIYIHYRGPMKG